MESGSKSKKQKKRVVFLEKIPFLIPAVLLGLFIGGYYFVSSIGLDLRYLITIVGFIISFYILLKTGKFKWFVMSIFLFLFLTNVATSTGVLMLSAGSDYGTTYHESDQNIVCVSPSYMNTWTGGEMVIFGKLDTYTIHITALSAFYRVHNGNSGNWAMRITYIENNKEQMAHTSYIYIEGDEQIIYTDTVVTVEKGVTVKVKVDVQSVIGGEGFIATLNFHVILSYVTTDPAQQNQAWGSVVSGDFSGIIGAILGAFSSIEAFFNFIIYVLPGIIIAIGIFYITIGRDPEGGVKTLFFGGMMYAGALIVNIMIAILGYNPFDYLNLGGVNLTFGLSLDMSMSGNASVDVLAMSGNFMLMAFIGLIIGFIVVDSGRVFVGIYNKIFKRGQKS